MAIKLEDGEEIDLLTDETGSDISENYQMPDGNSDGTDAIFLENIFGDAPNNWSDQQTNTMAIKTDGTYTDDDLNMLEGGNVINEPRMPDYTFTSPGSIFDIPGITSNVPIGADAASGFLTGAVPTFTAPTFTAPGTNLADLGMFQPSGPMMGNTFLASPSGLGPSGIDYSRVGQEWWQRGAEPTGDMTDFTLAGTPYRNIGIATGTPSTTETGITTLTQPPTVTSPAQATVTTGATGDVVRLDPFRVGAGGALPDFLPPGYTVPPITGGNALLGGVTTPTEGVVTLDPFQVTTSRLPTATLNLSQPSQTTTTTTAPTATTPSGVTTLPAVTVRGQPINPIDFMQNVVTKDWGTPQNPVILPPVTATGVSTPTVTSPTVTPPRITPPTPNVIVPPLITPPTTTTTPPPTFLPPTTLPTTPVGGGGATTTGTTSTTSAMNYRDLEAELGKSLGALQKYQPQMLGMYSDIYQKFMPESLTAASRSALGQLQADEAKLARLRAGQLSPEDVRQSQQAAREAYGARGQVMGPGAVGAEILNREAIRQQREDQARAAYQASMGNLFNAANLQTGNIFNPIASLISGSFNPLGAYPADVYGTNVNAQLAREIAQKNYEAAVKSAELAGGAQRTAATTSTIGNIFGAALPGIIGAICWVAREIYGEDNPRWMLFRDWLFRYAPQWFFNWYVNNGEAFAGWLKKNAWLKPVIRRWMDSRIRSMQNRELVLKEAV